MDCQSGGPPKGVNFTYFPEANLIRRALPGAVPPCGHGWKYPRDEDSGIPEECRDSRLAQ